jgi:hypothetical protein
MRRCSLFIPNSPIVLVLRRRLRIEAIERKAENKVKEARVGNFAGTTGKRTKDDDDDEDEDEDD